MTASPTIDLINMTKAVSTKNSTKSYAKDSSDFENVLNDVNKNYSKNEDVKKETTTQHEHKVQEENSTSTSEHNIDKTADKKQNTEAEESSHKEQEDHNSSQNQNAEDDSTNQETVSESKTEAESSNENSETTNETETSAESTENIETLIANSKIIQKDNQDVQIQQPVESSSETPIKAPEETKAETDTTEQKAVSETVSANIDNISSEIILNQNIVQKTDDNQIIQPKNNITADLVNQQRANAESITSVSNQEVANAQTATIIDLNNKLTNVLNEQNLPVDNSQTNSKIQIQTQTQQTLSNITVDSQETPVAQQADTTLQNIDSQTPVIEAATEAMVSEAETMESRQNLKDFLDKNSLNQDILDKTNAKIVSVETSNASNSDLNNNYQGNQNAQEQAVKIQLESASTSADIDMSAVEVNNQSGFSKILDSTQVQGQLQNAQTPKELTQNDIVAQISKQLAAKNLQDDGTTKITMVLKPENLGKVSIELINTKEGLTAQMITDNAQVREMLAKNLDGLKETLAQQGVQVNNVTVKVDETQKQSNDMMSFENQTGQQNQQQKNNTNKTQDEFSFENDSNDSISSNEGEVIQNDAAAEVNQYAGQVDYKV